MLRLKLNHVSKRGHREPNNWHRVGSSYVICDGQDFTPQFIAHVSLKMSVEFLEFRDKYLQVILDKELNTLWGLTQYNTGHTETISNLSVRNTWAPGDAYMRL